MEVQSNDVQIVIKSVESDGIIISNAKQFSAKEEDIKTTEYFLNIEDEQSADAVEEAEAQFVTVEGDDNEYIAVEIDGSEQIILNNKEVIIFTELCRICASESDRFIPIFTGEGLEHELSQKIHTYLPLRVSESDTLPLQVCYNCAATLLSWHEMVRNCASAQQRLTELQNKFSSKEQYYNESAVDDDDENTDSAENKAVNEEAQVQLENENEIDETMQVVDIAEANRSKGPQQISRSFKEFRKNFKPSISAVKNPCAPQTSTKPAPKKGPARSSKGKPTKGVAGSKTSSKSHPVSVKQESEDSENSASAKVEPSTFGSSAANESRDSSEEEPADGNDSDYDKLTVCEAPKSKKRRKRTADTAFQCEQCGKRFRQEASYQIHMRIHTGEKPYTCHVCGKQFGQTGSLYYHLKHVHGGVKNHACDICGRCFAMKTAMEDHRRIHTGERPYVCDSCGKTFKTKASLYIHSKIHTDEYPFKCSYCKKLFRWKQQMISHETTHTGEKNHICDICGKGFGVKNELTRHRRTHSSDKPFTCQKCGVSFGQKRYLTNHTRTRHKIKATAN